jgi:hypothetical protein
MLKWLTNVNAALNCSDEGHEAAAAAAAAAAEEGEHDERATESWHRTTEKWFRSSI